MRSFKVILVKVFIKIICFLELIYTLFAYGKKKDSSRILLDFETVAQKKAYNNLVKINFSSTVITKVLVVIPFCDRWDLTSVCLDGLLAQHKDNIEIVLALIDNRSQKKNTKEEFANFNVTNTKFKLYKLADKGEFNYSRINNNAVNKVSQIEKNIDYIWFLNNDISFVDQHTLKTYVDFARSSKNLGALGSTLLYPDKKTIQHLFISPGIKIVGAHPLKGKKFDLTQAWYKSPRPVAAVTGASLLLSYDNFFNLGGFDTELATTAQDLDLCLRLSEKGLVSWALTSTYLIHHESISRKHTLSKKDICCFYDKWQHKVSLSEYYSQNFSTYSEYPLLSLGLGRYPWRKVI